MGKKSAGPIGSVVVAGGGIAGMQASLDLANSGYRVHLVEKSTAIGGVMSELDKTFPPMTVPCELFTQTGRGRPASEHQPDHMCRD